MSAQDWEDLRETDAAYRGLSDVQCEVKYYRLAERSTAALLATLAEVGASAGLMLEVTYHAR